MLGRTDSRLRLVACSASLRSSPRRWASGSATGRWPRARSSGTWPTRSWPDRRRPNSAPRRHHRPARQRAGHDRLPRPARRLSRPGARRRSARPTAGQLAAILGSTLSSRPTATRSAGMPRRATPYVGPRAAADRRPERPGAARPRRRATCRRSASSRTRCASTRTPAARRARRWPASCSASSPQDGQGRYGIEQRDQALLAGRAPTAAIAGRRRDSASLDRQTGGRRPADHRRQPPAAPREGALRAVGRRQGARA